MLARQNAGCMMEGGYDDDSTSERKGARCEGGEDAEMDGYVRVCRSGAGVGLDALYSSGRVSMTSPVVSAAPVERGTAYKMVHLLFFFVAVCWGRGLRTALRAVSWGRGEGRAVHTEWPRRKRSSGCAV